MKTYIHLAYHVDEIFTAKRISEQEAKKIYDSADDGSFISSWPDFETLEIGDVIDLRREYEQLVVVD